MSKMTVEQFLDYLDGYGIVFEDEDIVKSALSDLGVRLEDTIAFDKDGKLETIEMDW